MKAKWLEDIMEREGFESVDFRGIKIGKYVFAIGWLTKEEK